ncbi:TPA: hypothetical protein HA239_02700 [Candidatus Woesearchaeota archaeon]|nr:hypothetical protein QT06_C0001G1140 [archaeon GW2011_AR15]MBS3104389.1 hypothetical protein [Candidatus Woesearchaeota archaeon]HIH41298.1 hypothetical protein [Candidatus Woesearchaeota archaeon]
MRIKEFVFLFVKSLSPQQYTMLITRKKRDAALYFTYLMILFVLISAVINIPSFYDFPQTIQKFNFTGIGEKTTVLQQPKVVLDFTPGEKDLTNEALIITEEKIVQWKFQPNISTFRLFEQETKEIPGYFYWILLLFLLPSYFFVAFVMTSVKYLLLGLLFVAIGIIFDLILKRKAGVFKLARAAAFSLTIPVLLASASILLGINLYPVLFYLVFSVIILLVITKKPMLG